jgi:hypothetical protein
MDQVAAQALDTQALEQILIGHMMAIGVSANVTRKTYLT